MKTPEHLPDAEIPAHATYEEYIQFDKMTRSDMGALSTKSALCIL
jgi:hypothetical protein